ncbi:KH domain-containing protein [Chlamydia psittaci]|uniref:KH domain-containing protein n=1 Tax=Chlamydia psittaci TaxID=83554 RepID=UPI00027E18F5|nr:KH domain-containing protein [Chlamydia psittaci]AFS24290.1 nucleic acid binding protein [Chlamydia psittaci WS/RT/E30]EPP31192.1 KH domain protein [Chlamydia psittaci C1/97]UWF55482.1 KH domain-containing protein [Chlamydia psittaci]
MEEFVAYIVKNLVADPEAVEIRSIQDESGESIKLEMRVAPDDIGKIIGRRGNTIHALRTILRRVCARLKKKIQIDLIQPGGIRESVDESEDVSGSFCLNSNNSSESEMAHQCCGRGNCCSAEDEDIEVSSVHHECSHNHHSE